MTTSASSGGQESTGPAWLALPPLTFVSNTPVNYVVPAATGQSLAYSVVSGLPTGLSFDPTTRTISGAAALSASTPLCFVPPNPAGNRWTGHYRKPLIESGVANPVAVPVVSTRCRT